MSVPVELVQAYATEFFGTQYRGPQAEMIARAFNTGQELRRAFDRLAGQDKLPAPNRLIGKDADLPEEAQYHPDMPIPEEGILCAWSFFQEREPGADEKYLNRRWMVLRIAAEVHCGKRPEYKVPGRVTSEVRAVLDDYKAQMEAVRLYCEGKYAS